jgi:hypothetical protein
MKEMSKCCDKAIGVCYSATLLAAQAMIADQHILETYLDARMKETEGIDITQGIAAAALLTNAVLACQVVAAPVSLSALGTFVATAAWPTVLMINPVGLVASAVGGTVLAVSMFRNSNRKEAIIRHQNCEYQFSSFEYAHI